MRTNIPPKEWDLLRKDVYADAGHKCEICGGVGPKWPVECHEVWHYDDTKMVQRLERMIALCPSCHQCKHIGLAEAQGKLAQARRHIKKVNGWTDEDLDVYLKSVWSEWHARSKCEWELDITSLDRYRNRSNNEW